MCGRVVSTSSASELAERFEVPSVPAEERARSWNIPPTAKLWTVLETGGERRLEMARWGLVPRWAKDPAIGSRMFNARAEGLLTSRAYRPALAARRCIVPVDGFYEWRRSGSRRGRAEAWYFTSTDGDVLALAGLWEPGRVPERRELHTFTIVTRPADEVMAPVHDRMPAVLRPDEWDRWLANGLAPDSAVELLCAPRPRLASRQVGAAVGSIRNDTPSLIDALGALPEPPAQDVQGP